MLSWIQDSYASVLADAQSRAVDIETRFAVLECRASFLSREPSAGGAMRVVRSRIDTRPY
jgi:hypothetical protein